VTGLSLQATDLAGKQVELLKELVRRGSRASAFIVNSHEPGNAAVDAGRALAACRGSACRPRRST
jgi:hypothetical protein